MNPRNPDDYGPLDPRLEAELIRRLASVRRQTESRWREPSFLRWLWERVTLSARRADAGPTRGNRRSRG